MNTKQITTAKRLVRETIERAQPNDKAELIDAINERFPGGAGGVGHAQARTRRAMFAVIDEVIAEIIAEQREATAIGWETKHENRHEAFDNYA